MAVQTKLQFIEQLKKSHIASEEMIALWCTGAPNDQAKTLAKQLVQNGHLTTWQAKHMLSGRHKIKFGSHVLLDRIAKDEIGTQYIARQILLDRQVKLTFLTEELSNKLAGRPELVRQIAKSADFDHTNLEHLHLIEREGNRFYLVTDYAPAKSLNDPESIARLTSEDVSDILSTAFEAISAAHRNGLSHGTLSEDNLLIDNSRKLTIRNTVLSFLVHSVDDENMSQSSCYKEDVESLVRIGKRLVSRLCHDEKLKSRYHSLFKRVLSKELSLQDAAVELQSDIRQSKTPTPNAKKSTQVSANNKKANVVAKPTTGSGIRHLWLVPTTITVIAFCGYLAYSNGWFADIDQTANRANQEITNKQELPGLNESLPDNNESRPNDSTEISAEFDSLESLPDVETEDTAALESELENDLADELGRPAPTTKVDSNDVSSTESLLGKFKSLTDETDDRDRNDSGIRQTEIDSRPMDVRENQTPDALADHQDREFPQHVQLPNVENTDPLLIADVPGGTKIKLQLISDEGKSSTETSFSMRGDSSRGWEILLKGNSSTNEIANLLLHGQRLEFRWSDSASNLESAPFLANCVLKIDLENTRYINLRKPVAIKGFKLDRKKPNLRLDVPAIAYAPKKIFAQLHDLPQDRFDDIVLVGDAENRHFARKRNLEIHFSELPEYQMLFLTLSSDLKKKYRLDASLKLRLDPTRKAVVADSKSVDSAKTLLESAIEEIQQRHDYLKDTAIADIRARFNLAAKAYPDKKRDAEVKQLKKQLELAEERAKKFRETLSNIEPFFESSIPVSIYFMVGGQRVVLASTTIE